MTAIPGPQSQAQVDILARGECPAITARRARRARESGTNQDPIVWRRARGANVEDVDGNVYVDFTSAFGVAALGHGHPKVVAAAHSQTDLLIHAMGDVYPSEAKVRLLTALSQVAPPGLSQAILGLSGASAVEAALKTAAIFSGKPGVLAFWGGYHGLSHGALAASAYRANFRAPFLGQLNPHIRHLPYPDPYRPPMGLPPGTPSEQISALCLGLVEETLSHQAGGGEAIGAVLIEPVQGRGGIVVPPPGFLAGLRGICDRLGLVLIFDEIYTGFGRTGKMWACEHESVVPDLMCVGKAMAGGFPLSAALGTREVMAAWGNSSGESIHTSTFLGNPLGCAMASAAIGVLVEEGWPAQVEAFGRWFGQRLRQVCQGVRGVGEVRGRGLMWGVDFVTDPQSRQADGARALQVTDALRQQGYLVLPAGVAGNVLALTPPFVTTVEQAEGMLTCLGEIVEEVPG